MTSQNPNRTEPE